MENFHDFSDLAQNAPVKKIQLSASQQALETGEIRMLDFMDLDGASGEIDDGILSDIFSLCKVQFEFKGSLAAMAVRNNILVMAMTHLHLLRIDLLNPHMIEGSFQLALPCSDRRFSKMSICRTRLMTR